MQKFLAGLIIRVLTSEQVRTMLKNILSELITEKVTPLIPLAAASAAQTFANLIPGVTATAEDVVQTANKVREDLNRAIPDIDLGIPLIDNILDVWRPKSN